jgi:hypothetical protein
MVCVAGVPGVDEIAARYKNRPLVQSGRVVLPVSVLCALVQLLTSRPRSVCWRLARQQQIEIDGHIHAQAPQAARLAQAVWQA